MRVRGVRRGVQQLVGIKGTEGKNGFEREEGQVSQVGRNSTGGAWLHTSPLNPSTTFTAFTMLSQVVGLTTCDAGRSLAPLAASATALLAVPGRLRTNVRVQGLRRCVSTVLSTASVAASTQACAPPLQAYLLQQRDASARAGAAHLWQASWRVLPRGCPPPFRLRRLRRHRLLGLLDAPTPWARMLDAARPTWRLQLRQLGRSGLLCCVGCWWGLANACAESALRCAGASGPSSSSMTVNRRSRRV